MTAEVVTAEVAEGQHQVDQEAASKEAARVEAATTAVTRAEAARVEAARVVAARAAEARAAAVKALPRSTCPLLPEHRKAQSHRSRNSDNADPCDQHCSRGLQGAAARRGSWHRSGTFAHCDCRRWWDSQRS